MVGADWFQYYDEPAHGRKLDGEDYNFGLVDIDDEPYVEIVETFKSLKPREMKSAAAMSRSRAVVSIPRAPEAPLADFRFMHALKTWNRVEGCVQPITPHSLGDLYVCWSPTALYVATFMLEMVEPDYYRTGGIPGIDRAKWTIQIDEREPVTARVGSGMKPVVNPGDVEIQSMSGTYNDVRCVTAVALPATMLGKERLKSGDRILLESSFTSHGKAYRSRWKGSFELAE